MSSNLHSHDFGFRSLSQSQPKSTNFGKLFGAEAPGGGYSHCGQTGGPVRAKEGQSKNFEKYPQMVVSFYKNPHMVVHEPENWVIW